MTEATIGHNSTLKLARDQLLSVIDRIESVERDIKDRQDDRKDIYAEAKGVGYDVAALKALIRIRKEDPAKREEREAILETYIQTIGTLD